MQSMDALAVQLNTWSEGLPKWQRDAPYVQHGCAIDGNSGVGQLVRRDELGGVHMRHPPSVWLTAAAAGRTAHLWPVNIPLITRYLRAVVMLPQGGQCCKRCCKRCCKQPLQQCLKGNACSSTKPREGNTSRSTKPREGNTSRSTKPREGNTSRSTKPREGNTSRSTKPREENTGGLAKDLLRCKRSGLRCCKISDCYVAN
jgi:hypothetical protein